MGPARRPRSHPPPLRGFWFLGEIPKCCGGLGGLTPNKTPVGVPPTNSRQVSRSCSVSKCPTWNAFAWTLWGAEKMFVSPGKTQTLQLRWDAVNQRCHREHLFRWSRFVFSIGIYIYVYIIDRYIISVKWELCNIDLWFMMIYVTNEKNTYI